MRPPKSTILRIVLGVFSFLPLLACAGILYFLFGIQTDDWLTGTPQAMLWFNMSWLAAIGAGFLGMAVAVYYILLVFSADASESQRMFWVLSLFFWFPISAPTFWYRVIWKGQPISLASVRA